MSPEILHVEMCGTAGWFQEAVAFSSACIISKVCLSPCHIRNSIKLFIVKDSFFTGTCATFFCWITQIIPFHQIDVQMEHCGTLYHSLLFQVITDTVCRITVILFKSVQPQVKIRHCHLQMGQSSAISPLNRDTVIGERHRYGYLALTRFIICTFLSGKSCHSPGIPGKAQNTYKDCTEQNATLSEPIQKASFLQLLPSLKKFPYVPLAGTSHRNFLFELILLLP